MLRSVRSRITLFATGVTLTVCLLTCAALYAGLHVALHREVDAFVMGEVQEFKAILVHEDEDDLAEIEREIRAELGSRAGNDLRFRLLDAGGHLLITSDPGDALPNPWVTPLTAHPDAAGAWLETMNQSSAPASVRVGSERMRLRGHGPVIVQAAYSLDRVNRTLSVCRWSCVAALLLAALFSILGGRAVARRSMRPVAAITQAARQVTGRRLSARVPRSGAGDELDDLAGTLNEMLDRVEQSFRQIQQFTADAAHELRTPLAALRGSAEHVLSQPRSEERLLSLIEQSLVYYRILSRVTDDLLLLTKLDSGQEPLRLAPFRLDAAVRDVVELYTPLATEQDIEIHVVSPDQVTVRADEGKIRRLVSNLLDNAIKYMTGAGTVSVDIQRSSGVVATIISDTGPGIPQEDLPRVFERFFRVDRARTHTSDAERRSVGLGLAICRSIVQAHGGEITVDSTPGRGTRVMFTLLADRRSA